MRVAFKVQHRVHHVFQHARARQRTLLVTWPTRITAMPVPLAMRVRCAVIRHLGDRPGALVSWSEYVVWMESITTTAGCVASTVARIFSS